MKNKIHLTLLFGFLALFLSACGGGGGGSATIPSVTSVAYSGASQVKTYSSGAQQSFDPVSSAIAWASDHVTKTTTYTYGDGASNAVVSTVSPAIGTPTYAAGVQTIVTTYGDGTTSTATNNSTSAPVTWAADHVTKTTTYTFANGATNPVVSTVAGVAGTPTYAAGVQTIVTTYGDGTTATATNNSTSSAVTWAADHVTKTTTYTFANGATNPVVSTVAGVAGTPTYASGVQTIVTTYGDGTTSTATNNSTSSAVTWAADHVTKTTTYTFANGATNPVVSTVAGVAGTPTYAAGVQTIVTTYGDGTTSTATNNSTSSAVTWAADHVTKTTTYTFANGATNPVVSTVAGTVSTPALTPAVYPANWTTTGTVTGPSVSSRSTTFGDGYVSTAQDGTSSLPFLQTTLAALPTPITDPNSNVTSTTTTYDLRWGTPDKSGPAYANIFSNGSVAQITGPTTLNFWGTTVGGQSTVGPTIGTPHPDVIAAWQSGWTGKGVNVLMEDGLTASPGNVPVHGVTTALLAQRYAIGSQFYGYNTETRLGIYNLDGTIASPSSMVNIGVVNASWGSNIWASAGHVRPFTAQEILTAYTSFVATGNGQLAVSRYTGASGWNNFNYQTAVIVKSAGNDAVPADYDGFGYTLAKNSNINPRLLIVGATNGPGSTGSPTSLASYSNYAGSDPDVQRRFLVAGGGVPFANGWLAINGIAITPTTVDPNTGAVISDSGTSYAAPRVAGYVAILRQKFPNLDAIKSSSIMLDTARYDTLTCYPNCDPAIYGKGEASLSRALAPVGYLR